MARFGHGSAKLARQAQSKEKVLAKMMAGGLAEKVVADKVGMATQLLYADYRLSLNWSHSIPLGGPILIPRLWSNSPTSHYGTECQLQVLLTNVSNLSSNP